MIEQQRQALSESEVGYRQLFEAHPNPMWIYDLETLRFLAVNNAAVSHYGFSRAEFLRMTLADIRPEEDVPDLLESITRISDGLDPGGVWRHRCKDGRIVFAEVCSHTIYFDDRRAEVVLARDVSDRQHDREAIRLGEERFIYAAKASTDAIWDWDLVADTVWRSDGTRALFRMPDVPISSSVDFWVSRIHPEDRTRVLQAFNAVIDGHSDNVTVEYRVNRDDGTLGYVLDRGFIMRDDNGKPVRIVGGMTDLSAVKEADARIREQASFIDKAHDAIIVRGLDHRVRFWNKSAERLYGWTDGEAAGRDLGELIYASADEFAKVTGKVLASGEWSGQVAQHDKDGRALIVEDHGTLIRNERGEATAILSINTDITRRVALEKQLHQTQRLDAIGHLTGGVAHDFNNLLTVILGNAEFLSEELADNDDLLPMAQMTVAAAQRGADLTRRLLAFAGRQSLEPKVVDANQLIDGMSGLLRRTLGEHIDITVHAANGLWQTLVDPSQLESALLNLCINARDAMSAGGRLTIETANAVLDAGPAGGASSTASLPGGRYVMIAVSDTGSGISPENISRIFDPFFTTKEVGKGTGLGLSMVYGFVKQSQGDIKVYSEPGRGTTMKMFLPSAEGVAEPDDEDADSLADFGGCETVLLVEDDELVRNHADNLLSALGYRVIPVADGPAALETIRHSGTVDLLFTDMVMPGGMSGRELADAARALQPGLRLLFTSGYAENAVNHQARIERGEFILSKPYRRIELARKVRAALSAGG